MPAEYMTTKEAAEYLGINEKQVYALVKVKSIPCTRVTGKWVFPKTLIDQWILGNARKEFPMPQHYLPRPEGALLAAGSNDPVLDILINTINPHGSGRHIFSGVTGSVEGMRLLGIGATDIAWCHLSSPDTGEYDIGSMPGLVPDRKIAIVHLFRRELGFVSMPGFCSGGLSFKKISDDGITFINRQAGSGTRVLIDHFLGREGIDPGNITGYGDEVNTHLEVGLRVASGRAAAGIASGAVAKMLGLDFSFLITESFDMALQQETFFLEEVQEFIETLKSEGFRGMVSSLGNYDFTKSGKIIYTS